MKDIKNIVVAALLAGATFSLNAAEPKKVPNFELLDKYQFGRDTKITLSNALKSDGTSGPVTFDTKEKPIIEAYIDPTQTTEIKIWRTVAGDTLLLGHYSIRAMAADRTIYLTVACDNESTNVSKGWYGKVYPQTGTYKGLSGKTRSGLSLAKNVKKEEITEIKKLNRVMSSKLSDRCWSGPEGKSVLDVLEGLGTLAEHLLLLKPGYAR